MKKNDKAQKKTEDKTGTAEKDATEKGSLASSNRHAQDDAAAPMWQGGEKAFCASRSGAVVSGSSSAR